MKNLKSYLLENINELKSLVSEINGYNGSLDYLEVWENEEYAINELFTSPYEALKSVYYGYYNINDDLIKFNDYDNIESLNECEYEDELKENIDDIVEELLACYIKIFISDELYVLIENALNEEK